MQSQDLQQVQDLMLRITVWVHCGHRLFEERSLSGLNRLDQNGSVQITVPCLAGSFRDEQTGVTGSGMEGVSVGVGQMFGTQGVRRTEP